MAISFAVLPKSVAAVDLICRAVEKKSGGRMFHGCDLRSRPCLPAFTVDRNSGDIYAQLR